MTETTETPMTLSISRVTSNQGPDYVAIAMRGEGRGSERIVVELSLEQFALVTTGLTVTDVPVRIRRVAEAEAGEQE